MTENFSVHYTPELNPDRSLPDSHQDAYSKTILGFWTYLLTDCLLFASLFLTYAVLMPNTFGGPGPKELYDLKSVFIQTMILLLSSAACGLMMLSSTKGKIKEAIIFLLITSFLGLLFLIMEYREFSTLVHEGNSWEKSAFLSSFFTLVGTHGTHIFFGLIWSAVMMGQLIFQGLTPITFKRLSCFSLYWHFLDLIWIFIFTFVYLMGVV